jgi:hypothetical protein
MFYSDYTRLWIYVHSASNTHTKRSFHCFLRENSEVAVGKIPTSKGFWCQNNRNCFGSRYAGVDKTSLWREVKFPSCASFSKQSTAFSWNAARALPCPFAHCDGRIRAVTRRSVRGTKHILVKTDNWIHLLRNDRFNHCMCYSGVGIARYRDGLRAGRLGFDSQQCIILLSPTASRLDVEATQPTIRLVPGGLSPGVKRCGREADYSPPSSAEVKNGGAVPALPHMFHGIMLN